MIDVHLERPEEREAALEVERIAFGEKGDGDVAIVLAVRDEPGSFGLVATDAGEVVGHVQFSPAAIGPTPVVALVRSACCLTAGAGGSAARSSGGGSTRRAREGSPL